MMEKFDYTKTPGKERKRFFAPNPEKALVSIITPYFNAGEYFEETFNSVVNQTFPWFEWIIINDGSYEKDSLEILDEFSKKDERIRVINQENGGLSCARNTGFRNARTEYVVPLDADDLISPQFIECLYWALINNPEAAWAYCDSFGFSAQEYIWRYPFDAKRMKKENMLVATAMIRKKDFDEIGGYKVEKWSYNEDWRFWLEMLSHHKKPVHIATPLFWYRRLDRGMLSSIKKNDERMKFNAHIIEQAASGVDENIKAIEYPFAKSNYSFYKPSYKEWNESSNPHKNGKRVLWLIPWMVMGGADKFNLDAISGLTQNGYENCILTTLSSDNEWRQRFEQYTDEIFCMADFLDPVQYIEFLSYFLQSRKIDVLIVTNSYDGYYMLPWIRQYFPELVILDYVHMEEWYWRAGGHARASSAITGISEKTYVCNSATRNVMLNKFECASENVECMYIGVDHQLFDKNKVQPGYLHELLNVKKDCPIVLFPCRIHEQKRPLMLVDIAEGVIKNVPDVVFVVAGDGPLLPDLKEKIIQKNLSKQIYCIGQIEDMRKCYRDSNLTLICSLKEGLSLTAYESCSMELPVVSSDVGGQSDLIGSDVGALIPLYQNEMTDLNKQEFAQEEIDEYVSEISRILKNPDLAATMGKNGRKKIEKQFSIAKMVEQLKNEIEYFCNNQEMRKRRNNLSFSLQQMSNLASDYYMVYCEWKRMEQKCEEQNGIYIYTNKLKNGILKLYSKIIVVPVLGIAVKKISHVIWCAVTGKRT